MIGEKNNDSKTKQQKKKIVKKIVFTKNCVGRKNADMGGVRVGPNPIFLFLVAFLCLLRCFFFLSFSVVGCKLAWVCYCPAQLCPGLSSDGSWVHRCIDGHPFLRLHQKVDDVIIRVARRARR